MRHRLAVLAVVAVVFCTTFASNGPSVLYVVYQRRDHFSSLVVTAIFATYALAVLATLLVVGRLSDVVGRRPVLIAGAALLVASAAVFALADSAAWLFAARGLQGVATGTLIAPAGAALVELAPPRHRARAALINTVSFLGGAASGSITFGLMVQYLPHPTALPFVIEGALDAVVLLAVALLVIETAPAIGTSSWRVERPSVPRDILGRFLLASSTMGIGWSLGGVYGALSPTMASQLLHLDSHVAAGAILCLFNLIGGLAQLASRRRTPRASMLGGLVLVALGAITIQLAFSVKAAALFFLATLLGGAGGGMAFVGSLALVNELSPRERRAETLAAYNLVGYLALSLPVIGVGLLTSALGLRRASFIFCVVLIIAVVVVGYGLRIVGTDPGRRVEELAPATAVR